MHDMTIGEDRNGVTRRLSLGDLTAYATILFDNCGHPTSLMLKCNNHGSIESGTLNSMAILGTLALKRGVGLVEIGESMRGLGYAPSGATGDKEFPLVSSFSDLWGRWLISRTEGK
jgi:hypothetical protein